jgi:hypothetical protein
VWAQGSDSDGVRYAADGTVVRPTDYREWVYLSTGLGMTYGPAAQAQTGNRPPNFDNVFVNRDSYRAFLKSGRWPDKTIFILEVREAIENASINNGGRTQGEILFMEAEVKDQKRFAATNGWGYFDFGRGANLARSAAPLEATARCYQCHKANTAVEQTFVQFYPELMDVARRLGTVRSDYDPARKP